MKKTYQRKKTTSNLYEVLGTVGKIIKNHNNKPYPILSNTVSKILITDLNEINDKNSNYIFNNNNEEEAVLELALHNISNQELNESLCYCLISTLMEYKEANITFELEYTDQLQWDRLFRLNPGPPLMQLEYKNTQSIREYFGEHWVNLPLNYSDSLEEIEENNSDFVPEATINEISMLVNKMSMAQKVAVDIVYHLYNEFSIAAPVLWISGKISNEDYIAGFYALENGTDIYEMTEEAYEEPRFEMNRLQYLKELLECYNNKDQTLPCVNF